MHSVHRAAPKVAWAEKEEPEQEIAQPSVRHPRIQGAGCRVQGAECRVQSAGCRVQGAGCRVQGAGCRVQGSVVTHPHLVPDDRIPPTLMPGSDRRFWPSDSLVETDGFRRVE